MSHAPITLRKSVSCQLSVVSYRNRLPTTDKLKFGAQGRTQTFNLWFVGPALHQLSYSGMLCTIVSFGRSLLCGPLCSSAFSAFNRHLYAEAAEIHRAPQRKQIRYATFCAKPLGHELVVGVGIEPTFRAFQARANPSQLSDRFSLGSWQDSNPQLRRSKRRTLPVELQEHEIGARGETRTHVYRICNPAP